MSELAEFHLRLPKDLHASVKKLASESGVSANYWIVDMLRVMVNSTKFVVSVTESEDGTVWYELHVPEDWITRSSTPS